MKKFEGTATVRSIDDILADTDAVRAKDAEIAGLRAQLAKAEDDRGTIHAAAMEALAQIAALRARLNVIMGYDMPELFDAWTDAERDEYAQLSPAEMFNSVRQMRAQLAAAQARIAELETWRPVEDGYTHLCQCPSCAFDAAYQGEAWRWQLYVNGDSIGIYDPANEDDDRSVELPPNLRLMVRP